MGKHYFTTLSEGSAKRKDILWLREDKKCSAVHNKLMKMRLDCIGKCCG